MTQKAEALKRKQLLAEAAEHMRRGHLIKASSSLHSALAIDPENHDTHFDIELRNPDFDGQCMCVYIYAGRHEQHEERAQSAM